MKYNEWTSIGYKIAADNFMQSKDLNKTATIFKTSNNNSQHSYCDAQQFVTSVYIMKTTTKKQIFLKGKNNYWMVSNFNLIKYAVEHLFIFSNVDRFMSTSFRALGPCNGINFFYINCIVTSRWRMESSIEVNVNLNILEHTCLFIYIISCHTLFTQSFNHILFFLT